MIMIFIKMNPLDDPIPLKISESKKFLDPRIATTRIIINPFQLEG